MTHGVHLCGLHRCLLSCAPQAAFHGVLHSLQFCSHDLVLLITFSTTIGRWASAFACNIAVRAAAASSTARYAGDLRDEVVDAVPSRHDDAFSRVSASCSHSVGGASFACQRSLPDKPPNDTWHSSSHQHRSCPPR